MITPERSRSRAAALGVIARFLIANYKDSRLYKGLSEKASDKAQDE